MGVTRVKNIVLVITVILFLVIFVFGHMHWKNEIAQNAKKAEAQVEKINDSDAAQNKNDDAKVTKRESTDATSNDFETLTQFLPDAVKNKILQAHDQQKQVQVVLAGGKEISGLASLLQAGLDTSYGKDFFKVTETNFDDQNSLTVYQGKLYTKLLDTNPDIIIFTSLLIHDLGKVSTSDTARVPVLIGNRIHETSPSTVFMIEPPNPVTFNDAINERVGDIKTEAGNAGIDYIDHLSSWPSSGDLAADLDSQGKYPNAQGLKVWADYLTGYFTSSN
jgi:hypothetical protein